VGCNGIIQLPLEQMQDLVSEAALVLCGAGYQPDVQIVRDVLD